MHRHRLIADDVADRHATARGQHTPDVGQEPLAGRGIHQIEDAVAENHVDAGVRHQRFSTVALLVQRLNGAFDETDIAITDGLGHHRCRLTGKGQHVGIAVHPQHSPISSDDLGADEGIFAAATAKIQHPITRTDPAGGIAAAVVTFHHRIRNHLKQCRVKTHRRAQAGLTLKGSGAVPGIHGVGLIQWFWRRAAGLRHQPKAS